MDPEDKKYILENREGKSAKIIAQIRGLKERKVKKFLDQHRHQELSARKKEDGPVKKSIIVISCIVILALGSIAYGNSLNGKFIWDDDYLIQQNAYIRNFSHISKIFTQDIGAGAGRAFSFYRPVQMATYLLDYRFWGLNTFGYHLGNMLLHILVALALYCLIRILCNGNNFTPLVTGAVYVVHPVHTGAISYISGRADPLAALFLLTCLIFYIKNLESKSVGSYIVIALSYILALLSKEYAIILPLILLLYHYSFRKRVNLISMLTVVSISLAYTFVRLTGLRHILPVRPGLQGETIFLARLPGFFAAITSYIRLLALPVDLHAEYGKKIFSPADPMTIIGVIILSAMIYCFFRKRKSDELVAFGLGWFLVMILPMSNLYPLNAYMAEHWLYLPSAGLMLIAAKGLNVLYKKSEVLRIVAVVFTVLLIAYYSGLTMRQNAYWKDPESFYEKSLKYSDDSVRVYNDIGKTYAMDGNTEKAIWAFKKAIEIDPKFPLPYNNLGFLYYGLGRKDEAIRLYEKAIELEPSYADALNNSGIIYSEKGMYPEAIDFYKRAIKANPNFDGAYSNLGAVYIALGRNEEAESAFKETLRINPRFGNAYYNLAILYAKTGKTTDSKEMYKKATELRPELNAPEYLNRLERYYKK